MAETIPEWAKETPEAPVKDTPKTEQKSIPEWAKDPSSVPTPSAAMMQNAPIEEPKTKRPEFDFNELGGAAVTSAIGGAALPQILKYGGAAAKALGGAYPGAAAVGGAMERMAPLVGGNALSRAGGGFVSGGLAESGGQAYEQFEGYGPGAEVTRFVVGGLPVSTLSTFASGKAGQIIRSISKEKIDFTKVNQELIRQREQAIGTLSGKGTTPEVTQRLFDSISKNANDEIGLLNTKTAHIYSQAEAEANNIQTRAKQLAEQRMKEATAKGKDITAAAIITASDLTKAFELKLTQLKANAEKEAEKILLSSKDTAQKIRNAAAGKAKEERNRMYSKASEIEKETQRNVDDFLRNNEEERRRLSSLAKRSSSRAERSGQYYEERLQRIGTPVTETELGKATRAPAENQLKTFKNQRNDLLKNEEQNVYKMARDNEIKGQRYTDTEAYKTGQKEIQELLTDPKTELVNSTVPQLRNQITSVQKAIAGLEQTTTNAAGETIKVIKPGSAKALEELRRFLSDRANGLPAEGFDAIGQSTARRLRDIVAHIEDEFITGKTLPRKAQVKEGEYPYQEGLLKDYFSKYKSASVPINDYKSLLGQKLVGKAEWDMSQFAEDAAVLGDSIFKTAGSVDAYTQLSGLPGQEVERLARQYVSNKLVNKGEDAASVLKANNDWLSTPQFRQLKQELIDLSESSQLAKKATGLLGGVKSKAIKSLKELFQTGKPIEEITNTGSKKRAGVISEARPKTAAGIVEAKKAEAGALKAGEAQKKQILSQALGQERDLTKNLRTQLKPIGTKAAQEKSAVLAAGKEESKSIIDSAKQEAIKASEALKQQAVIPEAESKALQSALNGLTETPKTAFEKIAFGNDPVKQLRIFAPYIKNTKQGITDYVNALREGLALRAKGNPSEMAREWQTRLAPANVGAGLMTQEQANEISMMLNTIKQITKGEIQQLSAMERFFVNSIRNNIYQVPGQVYRRSQEDATAQGK